MIGNCPPSLQPVTVEKVAINAVLAGATQVHFPTILAAVKAMLDPAFGLHGVHATTMGVSIGVLVTPGARGDDACINSAHSALGSGHRANACIGRTVKLVLQNVGGAKLGGTESTTIGNPCKYSVCTAENVSCLKGWEPFAATLLGKGYDPARSYVTVHAISSGPEQLVDADTTDANVLIEKMAKKMSACWGAHIPFLNEIIVFVSPEHVRTLQRGGVKSKADLQQRLFHASNEALSREYATLVGALQKTGTSSPVVKAVFELLGFVLYLIFRLIALLVPAAPRSLVLNIFIALGISLALATPFDYVKALQFGCILTLLAHLPPVVRLKNALFALSKFTSPSSIHVIAVGSEAGKFSLILPWIWHGFRSYSKRPIS